MTLAFSWKLLHCMFRARGLVPCQPEWIAALERHAACFSFPSSPINPSAQHQNLISPSASEALVSYTSSPSSSRPPVRYNKLKFSELVRDGNMVSAKRLVQMVNKWQRMAAMARRITLTPAKGTTEGSSYSTSPVAGKGHCVVYSADGRRFEVPLAYLGTAVFGVLLSLSQEEFGFSGDDGRIMVPCDAALMEYVMCLLRTDASEEVVRAFLSSMVKPYHCGNGLAQSMGISQQAVF